MILPKSFQKMHVALCQEFFLKFQKLKNDLSDSEIDFEVLEDSNSFGLLKSIKKDIDKRFELTELHLLSAVLDSNLKHTSFSNI